MYDKQESFMQVTNFQYVSVWDVLSNLGGFLKIVGLTLGLFAPCFFKCFLNDVSKAFHK